MAVNTAANGKLQYEGGQTFVSMVALTDSGDNQIFNSASTLMSDKSGYQPVIRQNGLVTGGAVTVGAGNDNVAVAGMTCYLAGVLTTVEADATNAIVRASTTNYMSISSVTITDAGAIAVLAGTEGAALSATRGAAGGAPWIPAGSIEIQQVKTTDDTAAAITSTELFGVVGTHVERYDFPAWDTIYNFNDDSDYAHVKLISELSESHSADAGSTTVSKEIYAEYYTPIFADQGYASDFVPPETTYSVSSTSVYGSALGAESSSLGQGSFTAYLDDGITDNIMAQKGSRLWFRFYPDRLKTPYLVCQGKLGMSRSFPAADNIQSACTISASTEGEEVSS